MTEAIQLRTINIPVPATAITREIIVGTAELIANSILDNHSAPQAYVVLDAMSKSFTMAQKDLKERAMGGLHEKSEAVYGVEVSTRSLGKKYDYHEDKELSLLNIQLADAENNVGIIKDQIKARQKYLESLREPKFADGTGEIIAEPAELLSDGVTLVLKYPKGVIDK